MVALGYALSSEEFRPNALVDQAARAEAAGFPFALISDHFHPWLDAQGQSPFVWATLGGIARATQRLRVGTGVTCPLIRLHPAVVAQAAATVADMLGGRFFLGVGTGENLNEHVTGQHWPPVATRRAMLAEAVGVVRALWQGGYTSRHGRFYAVENARLYTLPDPLPPIYVAASGPKAAQLAGEIGDGLIATTPDAQLVAAFAAAGGADKPRYGQVTVCWGPDAGAAIDLARRQWGYAALPGQLSQELALPLYFEQAARVVTEEQVAEAVVCGPDPAPYVAKIQAFADAGFSHVYLHQVGPAQDGFVAFAQRELLPAFS